MATSFEIMSVRIGMIKTSMGLSSIKTLVEQHCEFQDWDLVKLHLSLFHAAEMAQLHNQGAPMSLIMHKTQVRARNAAIEYHLFRNIATGGWCKDTIRKYNAQFFSTWFDLELQEVEEEDHANAKHEVGETSGDKNTGVKSHQEEEEIVEEFLSKAVIGQGVLEFAGKVKDVVCSGVRNMLVGTMTYIMDAIKEAFERCFGSWLPKLKSACSWVQNVFGVVKRWADEAHEKMGGYLQGIEECWYMGIALTACTCIVALLERFLIAAGIMSGTCGAPMLFLTISVGAICALKTVDWLDTDFTSDLILFVQSTCGNLMGFLCRHPETAARWSDEKSAQEPSMEGQFGVSALVENMAELVSGWNTKTITEVGRTFGAITQIKNGVLSMKDMLAYVFGKFQAVASHALGIESQVIADLSLLLGENVADWLEECDAMVAYSLEFKMDYRDVYDRLAQLIEKGKAIRAVMVRTQQRNTMHVSNLINKALDRLKELHASMVMIGSNKSRKAPFFVFFRGESGVGKSSVVQRASIDWLIAEKMNVEDIYSRNGLDTFWSGYKRQAVVLYDDFGAVPGDVSNEAEIINVVSRNPHAINMAGLNEKGMYFDSRIIFASSNFLAASPESKVHDRTAYERRRHMVIEVELKEGVTYNSADPTANQVYILRDSCAPYTVRRTFETYEELWSYMYSKYKEHDEDERKFLDSLPLAEENKSQALEGIIAISAMLANTVPQKVMKYMTKHLQNHHYLIYDAGRVLFWHECGKVVSVKQEVIGLSVQEIMEMKQTTLKSALMYQNMAKMFPLANPLAMMYATKIVTRGWVNAEYVASDACEDDYVKEKVNELPEWQRAYLYVLSTHLRAEVGTGWFRTLLQEAKKGMRAMYMKEYSRWPIVLRLAFGTALAVLFGGTIYYTIKGLWSLGSGAAFLMGASVAFDTKKSAQSDMPNRKSSSEFMFRNRKVKVRAWEGQSPCYGDTAQWAIDKFAATIHVADQVAQVCLVPGKGFLGVAHCLDNIPDRMMVRLQASDAETWFIWEKRNLVSFEGNELKLYTSSVLPRNSQALKDRMLYDEEKLPSKFKALFFSNKRDPLLGEEVSEIAEINCRKRTVACTVVQGEYRRVVSKGLEYDSPTVRNDCGSLVLTEIEGKYMVVGIHIAGTGDSGMAGYVPFYETYTQLEAQGSFLPEVDFWDQEKVLGPGCKVLGVLKPGFSVGGARVTQLKATEQEWHLDTPCDKEPSILIKGDPRLAGTENANYDPYLGSMSKYAMEAGPFEDAIMEQVKMDVVDSWYDARDDFTFEEVSLDLAINGLEGVEYFDSLVLSTSEGFPYRLDRKPGDKGKERYIVGEPGSYRIENEEIMKDIDWYEQQSKVKVPAIYCIECVKDERLPVRKVRVTPKSRTFSVLPMTYNLVVRKKFLNFVKFIMERRHKLPCQVGINPYSREWDRLAMSLLEKGNTIYCCDYSRFDGFLPKYLMKKMAEAINALCGGSVELQRQRENLMMACCSRYAICEKLLLQVENGIPSGFPLTVIINSILNEFLVRYCYRKCFENEGALQLQFDTHVKLVVYGDDNLISVSEAISSRFNGNYIKGLMATFGVTITDGVDKTLASIEARTLEQCDFLKRSFKRTREGLWVGPLQKEVLWPQLHYVRCSKLEKQEAYIANLNSVIRELFLHSPEEAKELRSKALSRLKWIQGKDLISLRQIDQFYDDQRNGRCDYLESAFQMQDMSLMEPLEPGVMPVKTREILPDIFVATEGKFYGDFKDYFVVSIATNRSFMPQEGIVIKYPLGSGRGGLCTTEFLRKNVLREGCTINKAIKQALRDNRKILFISQNSLVPAWVFSVTLLNSMGKIPLVVTNKCLAEAIGVCKTLAYLPKEMPELFVK